MPKETKSQFTNLPERDRWPHLQDAAQNTIHLQNHHLVQSTQHDHLSIELIHRNCGQKNHLDRGESAKPVFILIQNEFPRARVLIRPLHQDYILTNNNQYLSRLWSTQRLGRQSRRHVSCCGLPTFHRVFFLFTMVASEKEGKETRGMDSMRWLYSLRRIIVVAEERKRFGEIKLRLQRDFLGSGDTIVVA